MQFVKSDNEVVQAFCLQSAPQKQTVKLVFGIIKEVLCFTSRNALL